MVPPDALLAQPGTHCKWATMTDGRIAGRCQPLRITQNFGGAGKTESNGFSRSGLGGNDQVAASSFRLQHCLLDGCEGRVSARGECVAERRRQIGKRHSISSREWGAGIRSRSEEHTSELQSLMRISYAVFCLKKKKKTDKEHTRQFNKQNNITYHKQPSPNAY